MKFRNNNILLGKFLLVALIMMVAQGVLLTQKAQAAALTSLKDTMSRLKASTNANHTISFVAPSGVANNTTITIDFNDGTNDPDTTGIVEDDVDIAGSTEGELTTGPDCTLTENASVAMNTTTDILTITLCAGDGGDFTGAETITIEIGNNATSSGTGANQIDNPTAANDVIFAVTAGASDTGSLAVSILAEDTVSVSATVNPGITFTITDTTVGFGSLTVGGARWATGTTGTGSQPATSAGAHEMTISTNAVSGYAITYNGATLTAVTPTISVATIAGDADGTPGSEQFAMALDDNGSNVTIVSDYDYALNNYKFVASTTTQIASETGPTATETLDVQYIANIAGDTEAGAYTTSILYVATGTF